MRKFIFASALVVALQSVLTSFAVAQTPLPQLPTPPASTNTPLLNAASVPADYRLDVEDMIAIRVLRHEDVSTVMKVPADGMVILPRLLTPVSVRGKTCGELANELQKRLVDEGRLKLKDGQVFIMVVERRPRRIYTRGNAIRGGEYDLKPGWRVTELMAIIGGTPPPERVTTTITNPKREQPITINLWDVLNDPSSVQNVALIEGDTVTINSPRSVRLSVRGEGPRGTYEFDERFTLKRALIQIGFSSTDTTASLKDAKIIRKATPGDPLSADVIIPVNLLQILQTDTVDHDIKDLDILDLPRGERWVYLFGEVGGPRKFPIPEDRPFYLADVMAISGNTPVQAKIGAIQIWRVEDGKEQKKEYDWGAYLKSGDPKNNPAIAANDRIFVPANTRRRDPIGDIWTGFGLYNLMKTFVPGLR